MSQSPRSSRVQTHLSSSPDKRLPPSEAVVDLVAPNVQDPGTVSDAEGGTRRLARLLTGETAREQRERSS